MKLSSTYLIGCPTIHSIVYPDKHIFTAVGADCNQPLGMESRKIPDDHISASSEWDPNHGPSNARLNFQPAGGKTGAWSAKTNDVNQWLQVDFGDTKKVTAILTQGRAEHDQWVKTYTVSYSQDGIEFIDYTQNGQKKVSSPVCS